MTTEESIKHLEALFERKVTVLSAEAMRLAVDALRAQRTQLDRSRWEWCDFCEKACRNCIYSGGAMGREPCRSCVGFSKFVSRFPGEYCRECGRPLTEQAWAELERRVNGGKTD